MTEHLNQISSPNPEQEKSSTEPEYVYFKNGETADYVKLYRKSGDTINFDNPSDYVHATTIVHTESGNDYVVNSEVVIDIGSGTGVDIGHNGTLEDIVVGKSWNVPGLAKSENVEYVLRDHKVASLDQAQSTGEKIRPNSPFPIARENIKKFIREHGLEEEKGLEVGKVSKRKLGSWIKDR